MAKATWEEATEWIKKYIETFGDNFPLICFGGDNDEIIAAIQECIKMNMTQEERTGITDDDII